MSLPQLVLFARVLRCCAQARPHCSAATGPRRDLQTTGSRSKSDDTEGVRATQWSLCTVLGNDAQLPSVLLLLLSPINILLVDACSGLAAQSPEARTAAAAASEVGWTSARHGQGTQVGRAPPCCSVGLCWTSGVVPIAVGGGGTCGTAAWWQCRQWWMWWAVVWACNRCKCWHIVSLKGSILSFGFWFVGWCQCLVNLTGARCSI
jgi:hypothetical protein